MKNLLLIMITICMITTAQAQKKVGGVVLPGKVSYKEYDLILNGAGVREKLWIDLYAAGLYLQEKNSNGNDILTAKKPVLLKLHIVSKLITSDKMVEAVNEGFKTSTNGNTAPIQQEINTILSFFKEDINENDVFDLVYDPSRGIVAHKNGLEKGVIKGDEFKTALFGIWLSNRPADDKLKNALLGK